MREKLISFSLALWVFYFFFFFLLCVCAGNERIEKSVPVWGLFEGLIDRMVMNRNYTALSDYQNDFKFDENDHAPKFRSIPSH